jgi:hypothetical protein
LALDSWNKASSKVVGFYPQKAALTTSFAEKIITTTGGQTGRRRYSTRQASSFGPLNGSSPEKQF